MPPATSFARCCSGAAPRRSYSMSAARCRAWPTKWCVSTSVATIVTVSPSSQQHNRHNKDGYCRLARTTTKTVLILLWSFVAATRNGLSSERFLRTQERRGIRVLRLLTQEGAGRVASPRRSNLAGAQGAGCQGQEFLAHPPPAVASRTRAHNVIVPMASCQTRTFDDLTTADHSHVPGLQA